MTLIIIIKLFFIFIITLGGTLLILPKLINIASTWTMTKEGIPDKRYSLMDEPDYFRKIHNVPKPVVGGLGMLIMVSLSSVLFVPPSDLSLRGYYSALILLGIVGFLDDFTELHYRWKFIAQIFATVIMIHYSESTLLSFGNILSFGSIDFGVFVAPVTIFCTVGVVNAINMIDGLDGLAGGVSLVAFIAFAILAYINHQMNIMLLDIALIGAVIGFLIYNWYPSKLFMGDAGSFFLGFSLAFLSIYITQTHNSFVPPVAALLILTVPVVDTLTVMIKRIIKGKNPFTADRNHLHHILMGYGLSVKTTVKVIVFLSAGFAFLAVVGTIFEIPDYYFFIVFATCFAINFIISLLNVRIRKNEGKSPIIN